MSDRRPFLVVAAAVAVWMSAHHGLLKVPTLPTFGGGDDKPAPTIPDKPDGADDQMWAAEAFAGHSEYAKVMAGTLATLCRYLEDDGASPEPLVTTPREFHALLQRVLDGVPEPTGVSLDASKRLATEMEKVAPEGADLDRAKVCRVLRGLAWCLNNEVKP